MEVNKDETGFHDETVSLPKQVLSVAVVNNFNYEPFVLPGTDGDAYKVWSEWYQGLEHVLEASNTPEEKKFSTLLAYGGKELRHVYSSICNGEIPKKERFETAVEKLEKYFKPKQHGTYLRVKFWEMTKESNETIDEFVTKLREKKRHCNFGNTKEEIEDFVMTDKFLMSMPQYIKQELIKDRKLTFESAVRQAKEIESSRNQARELSAPLREKPFLGSVNRLQERRDVVCYRCGSRNHKSNSEKCSAKDAMCYDCGVKGHFANSRFCKNPKRGKREASQRRYELEPPTKRRKMNVRNIEDNEVVCNVNSTGVNVVCRIEGLYVRMLVDSGTNRNIVDEKTWKLMLAKGFQPKREFFDNQVKFMGYGNVKLKQLSAFEADIAVEIDGKCYKETSKFYVIENGSQPLLSKGRKFEVI